MLISNFPQNIYSTKSEIKYTYCSCRIYIRAILWERFKYLFKVSYPYVKVPIDVAIDNRNVIFI